METESNSDFVTEYIEPDQILLHRLERRLTNGSISLQELVSAEGIESALKQQRKNCSKRPVLYYGVHDARLFGYSTP